MTKTESTQIVPSGKLNTIDGENVFVPDGTSTTVTIVDIYADEGKVFVDKRSNSVLGNHITLGTDDIAYNYEEVSA